MKRDIDPGSGINELALAEIIRAKGGTLNVPDPVTGGRAEVGVVTGEGGKPEFVIRTHGEVYSIDPRGIVQDMMRDDLCNIPG